MQQKPEAVTKIWVAQKGGINSKVHLAVDAHGMPIRVLITLGTTANCSQAQQLIEGINADYLLADRGYDSNDIVTQAELQGMIPVMPPRKNRKDQRQYDKD